MKIKRNKIIIGLFVFLIIHLVYLFTISVDCQWGDGIELTISAWTLGVSHPTGYPLYTLLGKLFTSLPFGTIAFRMHYFSAVAGSLAVLFLFLIICEIFSLYLQKYKKEEVGLFHLIVAGLLSILFGLTRDFWLLSNVAEVYSLNAFFMLVFIYLIIRFLATNSNYYVPLLSLILGLGLAHHLQTISLVPILFICIIIKRKIINFKIISISFILFLLGLSFYSYLFISAMKNPVMNWGNPRNLKNFLWVVTGEQFRVTKYILMTGRSLLNEISKAFLLLGEQWFDLTEKSILFKFLVSGIIIIIFIISMLSLIKINRGIGFIILSIFLLSFALTMSHPIPDNEGYFHINYACLFIALSAFIIHLFSIIKLLPLSRKIAITVILIAFNLALYLTNLPYCDRRDYPYAEVYGRFIMSHLAPDSMILTNGDDDIFSLWYQKYVENNRRDVTILGANFLASEWYKNYFDEELKSGKVKLRFANRIFFSEMDYLNFLVREIVEPNYDNLRIYSTYTEPNLNRFNRYEYIFGGTVDLGKQNPYSQFIAKYTMPIGAVWRIKRIEKKSLFFVDIPD